jgi:hypothetical protein
VADCRVAAARCIVVSDLKSDALLRASNTIANQLTSGHSSRNRACKLSRCAFRGCLFGWKCPGSIFRFHAKSSPSPSLDMLGGHGLTSNRNLSSCEVP